MYLQENALFDIDLGIKVARNCANYTLHHVTTYALAMFEVALFPYEYIVIELMLLILFYPYPE